MNKNISVIKNTLQMVKKFLPPVGTELGEYKFLDAEALWCGTVASVRPFVVFAEDDVCGVFIAVMADGPVYIIEPPYNDLQKSDYRKALNVNNECLVSYCSADFAKLCKLRTYI